MPEKYQLKCVLDEQLADGCPDGQNRTVWLAQAQLIFDYGSAADHPSSTCYCTHMCNARCVQDPTSSEPKCYAAPGISAAWLMLRAAGLARNTGPPLASSIARLL